ncbi:MAG: hypothetical protein AB8F74_01785 [Saprospiraceae bacterium]
MNFSFLFSFLIVGTFAVSNVSTFDNTSYVSSSEIEEVLDDHFLKDVKSAELHSELEEYIGAVVGTIDHITANRTGVEGSYYYAVYSTKEEVKDVNLFKIEKEHFDNESFYENLEAVNMLPTCRAGIFCPPACDNYPVGSCLGMTCQGC